MTINKTDKNDARGIAEALRLGHYKQCVHRSDDSLETRTLLNGRGTLVDERTYLVSSIKGHLKVYGVKLGKDKSFREKVETSISALKASVQKTVQALLNVLDVLDEEIKKLDKEVIQLGRHDADVQLLQSIVCRSYADSVFIWRDSTTRGRSPKEGLDEQDVYL